MRLRPAITLTVLALLTVAVYGTHVRTAGYVYEDANAVWQHPGVIGQQPIDVTRARWLAATSHRAVFTFVSPNPAATHAVNVGLHLVNGLLVYAVGLAWLTPPAACLAAGLFLLQPIQTEAVAYAASRSELLATTFALIALWLSLRPSRRWWHSVGLWLAVALAVSAKETAAVIVPVMALADYTLRRRQSWSRLAWLIVPVAVMAVSVLALDFTKHAEWSVVGYVGLTAAAVWRYLALSVVPIGLSIDHDWYAVPQVVQMLALVYLITWAGIGVWMVSAARSAPAWVQAIGFGWWWALLEVAPRLVVRTPEILNEHQWYRPSIGLALLSAAIVGQWASRASWSLRPHAQEHAHGTST